MSKISELADGGALQSTDYLVAVRSGGNVKVQLSELPSGIGAGGNIVFGDNEKAIFGAGSDLQIYHDGTQSLISEIGTGNLSINGTSINFNNNDLGGRYAEFVSNGAVNLFYAGNKKLATATTGIDVTGTVTADGLTVGAGDQINYGGTAFDYIAHDVANNAGIINHRNIVKINVDSNNDSSTDGYFGVGRDGTDESSTDMFRIAQNGDISFYEDTGTTAKFFWDASAESLGIGTTSPATPLEVVSSVSVPLTITRTTSTGSVGIRFSNSSGQRGAIYGEGASGGLLFFNQSSEAMRITSAGNVGIGTSSPTGNANASSLVLEVHGSGANPPEILAGGQNAEISIAGGNAASYLWSTGAYPLVMAVNATEAMRIDSSGNVGIGTTSPSSRLNIVQASDGLVTGFRSDSPTSNSYAALSMDGDDALVVAGNSGGENTTLRFYTAASGSEAERMRIDSSGNVGIGTTSPAKTLHVEGEILSLISGGTPALFLNNGVTQLNINNSSGSMVFDGDGSTERMRIDSSGNLLVGTTTTTLTTNDGIHLSSDGFLHASRDGNISGQFNRINSDGDIVRFRKDGSTVGSIGVAGSRPYFSNNVNFSVKIDDFANGSFLPANQTGAVSDNVSDIGSASARWDDIYATNGTIQTSDRNEKENIRELLEAEARVAQAAKGLLRAFQWKDSVAEKGDDARIHFGIIAQDLEAAFEAEGLDAGRYAMFIHSTWTDEETGEERSRMGVRYSELLAFIIAAL
jgi:hypothetical protein